MLPGLAGRCNKLLFELSSTSTSALFLTSLTSAYILSSVIQVLAGNPAALTSPLPPHPNQGLDPMLLPLRLLSRQRQGRMQLQVQVHKQLQMQQLSKCSKMLRRHLSTRLCGFRTAKWAPVGVMRMCQVA